jgi:hypothetical protein
MANKTIPIIGKLASPAERASGKGESHARYQDLDWEAFVDLLRHQFNSEGKGINEVAQGLGWPSGLLRAAFSGRRLRDVRVDQLLSYLGLTAAEIPRLKAQEPRHPGNRIFISYSHKDQAYLERLMVHLRPLEKKGIIDAWVDTRLKIGDKWRKEIGDALKHASVGILLVSADFLASDFIIDDELPPLLRSAEEKGTLILPVILKPCRFARENSLNEFQAANSPDEPLSVLDESEREFVFDTIAQRIEDTLPEKKA